MYKANLQLLSLIFYNFTKFLFRLRLVMIPYLPFRWMLGNNDYLKVGTIKKLEVQDHYPSGPSNRNSAIVGHIFMEDCNASNTCVIVCLQSACDIKANSHTHTWYDVVQFPATKFTQEFDQPQNTVKGSQKAWQWNNLKLCGCKVNFLSICAYTHVCHKHTHLIFTFHTRMDQTGCHSPSNFPQSAWFLQLDSLPDTSHFTVCTGCFSCGTSIWWVKFLIRCR